MHPECIGEKTESEGGKVIGFRKGTNSGQTGDVEDRQERRYSRNGLVEVAQPVEAGIGDWNARL